MSKLTLKELKNFLDELEGYPDDAVVKIDCGELWIDAVDVSGWISEDGHTVVIESGGELNE